MIKLGKFTYSHDEWGQLIKIRGSGLIKPFPDKDGYLKYHLRQQGTTYNIFVHQVIWLIFKGDIPDGLVIDHINDNRQDNNINNLQLLTVEENVVKGSAKTWVVISPSGEEQTIYNLESFCRQFNLNASEMSNVAHGRRNQTQHKGWKCKLIS